MITNWLCRKKGLRSADFVGLHFSGLRENHQTADTRLTLHNIRTKSAENLNSFIPMDIVGAQRNGDSLGFERLQNCARILELLRGEIGVV